VIFSAQISQEIMLHKIGKRDLHIILKVLPNEIIKIYITRSLQRRSCPTQASVQVQVELPETEGLWLTASTDTVEQFLRPAPSVMLSSSASDKIEETLLTVKNIKFVYYMTMM
jgi:hypothetical protein